MEYLSTESWQEQYRNVVRLFTGQVNSKKNTIVSEHDSIVFETILVQLKTIEAKFPKNVKIEIKEYLWN